MLAQAEAPRRFSTLPDSLPSKVISACPALPREFRDFSGPAFQGGQEGKKKKDFLHHFLRFPIHCRVRLEWLGSASGPPVTATVCLLIGQSRTDWTLRYLSTPRTQPEKAFSQEYDPPRLGWQGHNQQLPDNGPSLHPWLRSGQNQPGSDHGPKTHLDGGLKDRRLIFRVLNLHISVWDFFYIYTKTPPSTH